MSVGPVLIVFCREPIAGLTKTRLTPRLGAENAALLGHAFTLDMLRKASDSGVARVVIAGSSAGDATRNPYFRRLARRFATEIVDQGKGSLGRRMSRAFEPFRHQGALLVGTDLPTLPAKMIGHLLRLLEKSRFVLAPTLDGGYYAIGVRGPMPPVFACIRWGTSRVFGETIKRARLSGTKPRVGPAWYDIDRWSDLMMLVVHLEHIEAKIGEVHSHPCPATAALLRRLGLLTRRG